MKVAVIVSSHSSKNPMEHAHLQQDSRVEEYNSPREKGSTCCASGTCMAKGFHVELGEEANFHQGTSVLGCLTLLASHHLGRRPEKSKEML